MIINPDVLEDLYCDAGESRKQKAEEYFNQKRINITKVLYENKENFEIQSRIRGKQGIYSAYVKVKDNDIEDLRCTCKDYELNYCSCKHIIAMMMEFINTPDYIDVFKGKEENKELVNLYNNNTNKYKIYNQLVNTFLPEEKLKKEEKRYIYNEEIQLVPKIIFNEITKNLKLELKVGTTQLYKIKNLVEFYNNIEKNEIFKYGLKLEFKHTLKAFVKDDLKLLEYVLKSAETIKYANEGHQYYSGMMSDSIITITNTGLDELFEVLNNKIISFESNNKEKKILFVDEEPEIKFFIKEYSDKEYSFYSNINFYDFNILMGKKNVYMLSENKLYKCSMQFYENIIKLLDIFKANLTSEIVFKKEESTKFFSIVMPNIKKYLEFENVDEEELEKYIPNKLQVKLFLDFDENNYVVAEIKFCYKDIEINPFSDEKKDIARDYLKEKSILEVFLNAGFMLDVKKSTLVLIKEQDIYNFLYNDIDKYMKEFEILTTEKFKEKELKKVELKNVGVKVESNLLEINLEGINFNEKELKAVLENYKLKKKYYRLKDGTFLDLQRNDTLDFIETLSMENDIDYKMLEKGEIKLPIYRSLYLDKLLDNLKIDSVKSLNYKRIVNDINDREIDEEIELPVNINANLRKYQKVGYKWLRVLDGYGFGGILADDMGLGKTLQLIAVILAYVQNEKNPKTSLVVSPSSLSLNWENEIKKFAPDLKVLVISGNQSERKRKIQLVDNYDVVISSYDLLKRDIEEYKKLNYIFKYIIADEAQYIKNNNTQNFKAIKQINAEARFALTGTPIENSLSELWSIFDFIMPGYLFNYRKFKEKFECPIIRDEDQDAMNRLKMLIEPFVLRRIKEEVLKELPDKTITVLNNEMEEEQLKVYMSYMAKAKKEVEEEIDINGLERSQIKILALLMRLRQVCCHPSLFIEDYQGGSSKLNQCIQIVKDAIQSGHKILLFSGYTSMFEMIEEEFKKENINYLKLTGQTKVTDRMDLVEEFNNDPEKEVFLISLKAGGTGLNLIGADMVIHYDPWWNLSAENQATDRTYRIGQKKNVQVYKLITKNSIEEKIYELQQKKAELIDSVLSTKETFVNKLSKEDIMSLFE